VSYIGYSKVNNRYIRDYSGANVLYGSIVVQSYTLRVEPGR